MKKFIEFHKINEDLESSEMKLLRNLYDFYKEKYGDDLDKFLDTIKDLHKKGELSKKSISDFLIEIGYEDDEYIFDMDEPDEDDDYDFIMDNEDEPDEYYPPKGQYSIGYYC